MKTKEKIDPKKFARIAGRELLLYHDVGWARWCSNGHVAVLVSMLRQEPVWDVSKAECLQKVCGALESIDASGWGSVVERTTTANWSPPIQNRDGSWSRSEPSVLFRRGDGVEIWVAARYLELLWPWAREGSAVWRHEGSELDPLVLCNVNMPHALVMPSRY